MKNTKKHPATTIGQDFNNKVAFVGLKLEMCSDLTEIISLLAEVSLNITQSDDTTNECITLLDKAKAIADKHSAVAPGFDNIYIALMQYNLSKLLFRRKQANASGVSV